MSFLAPKTELPGDLTNATPGRQSTTSPTRVIPLVYGRARLAVSWETPVLHWAFRNTKTSSYAFFSGFGSIAHGPVDEIVSVNVGSKGYQGIFQFRADNPGDYLEYVRPGDPPTRFLFWWGLENHANYGATIDSLIKDATHPLKGKPHPNYRGIFTLLVENMEAGRADGGMTPPVPELQIEFHRRSPKAYSFGYAAHGAHPVGTVWDILEDKRAGVGAPAAMFDAAHQTASMQRVMDVGVGGFTGTDLFVSTVLAEAREANEQIADVLGHLDGWLTERNGKLYVDWSPADGSTASPAGLREISKHHIDGDVDKDPDGLDALASRVVVSCLNWQADPSLSEDSVTSGVPFARKVLGEERPPLQLQRRGFTTTWQAKAYADIQALARASLGLRATIPVLRQYAVHPDGVTPLLPGDRFLFVDRNFSVVVRIIEREESSDTVVRFKVQRERGAFPKPYQPAIDPRAALDTPPPADLQRFVIAQLPPDLSDAGDTMVAPLVERPSTRTVGYQVQFSPSNTWPGQTVESGATRWAVAAILRTALGVSYAAAVVTVDTTGVDWSTLVSQSVLQQDDDQLLLWHAGEWFSVGTITPLGAGSYSLALARGRLGSVPVAHGTGSVVFLQYRSELVPLQHADFANVESGGAYDAGVATKWFKLRPYNSATQGNLTAATSCVLRDPTPAAPGGITAAGGPGVISVSWTAPAGALVAEYRVFRATGPGYGDEAEVAQVSATRFVDAQVVIGTTYRYRLKAIATDETESPFSATSSATATGTPPSVDPTPPANPGTVTLASAGTYLSDDGANFAYVIVNIPAMPSGAALQNLLRRPNGSSAQWSVVGQVTNTSATTLRDDDLVVGRNYDYALQAFSAYGVASAIVQGSAMPYGAVDSTAPAAPTGVSAVAGTGKSVKVGWAANAEADLDEYRIYRGTTNNPAAATLIAEISGTSYLDNNVALGTTYWYFIAAVDRSENESSKSTGAAATPEVVPANQVDATPPAAPGTMGITGSGAYVSAAGNVLSYLQFSLPALPAGAVVQNVLYRRVGAIEYMVAAQIANAAATTVRVDDLTPGVSYEMALQAFSFTGVPSVLVEAAGNPHIAPDKDTAPSIPTGISALAGTGKSVKVGWAANTEPDLDEYRVYRGTTNNPAAATLIAEISGTSYLDNNVALGTTYWYFISAVDRSENESGKSIGASATPSAVPASQIDATPPGAPGTMSLTAAGAYLSASGSVLAYLQFTVPGLPTGAVVQNVLYRRSGAAEYMVATQLANGSGTTVRVDDLTPGVAYDFALQAFSFTGTPSSVTAATGSPHTAPAKSTSPNPPTGASLSKAEIPVRFFATTAVRMYGSRVKWTNPADKDLAGVQVKATLTDSDSAIDYSWTGDSLDLVVGSEVCLYTPSLAAGYVRIRAKDTSGNYSAWVRVGNIYGDSQFTMPLGDLADQNSTDAKVSGIKTGASGSASVTKVLARHVTSAVVTTAGGAGSESFNLSLTGRGFGTKPDVGHVGIAGTPSNVIGAYDFDAGGNSSTNAVIKLTRTDGGTFGAGNSYRLNIELIEYD